MMASFEGFAAAADGVMILQQCTVGAELMCMGSAVQGLVTVVGV